MARKPILLCVLLIALVAAIAYLARISSRDSGDVTAPAGAAVAASNAVESTVAVPSVAGAQTRSATALQPAEIAASAPEPSASAFKLHGKIVDARRFAAPGVEVKMVRASGATTSVRSNEQGLFEFTIPERAVKYEQVSLWALRSGEAVVKSVAIPGSQQSAMRGFLYHQPSLGDLDAGTLTLQSASEMQISVVESARPAPNTEVRIWLGVESTILWRGSTDAAGILTTPALPAGCTNVEAVRGSADARVRVYLPSEARLQLELMPRFEGVIALLEKQGGAPIPGAQVEIGEQVWAPALPENSKGMGMGEYTTSRAVEGGKQTTDAQGVARFPGLSTKVEYQVRVLPAGFVGYPPQGSGGERLKLTKPELRLELERTPTRTVRWPIVAGEVPMPAEGARVTLRSAPGAPRDPRTDVARPDQLATVHESNMVALSIEGYGNFLAIAPDGSIAAAWVAGDADVGKPLSFRKPRTIEVSVHDSNGAAVEGAIASARNQGNNSLGTPAQTDAEGLARLTGLYGELADVYVLGPDADAREERAGTVDLKAADSRIEYVLVPASLASMRARLEVRIDGVAQLPPDYRLGAKLLEEKPETGELLVSVALPTEGNEVGVSLTSTGYLPAKATLPVVRDGSEPRAVLELVRSATLTARVTMPRVKDWVEIKIQSWNEAKQAWGMVSPYINGLHTPNGPGGSFRFFQLAPGRYQVLDERSHVESEAVEIVAGQLEAQVDLDLDGLEWVSGRIEVPDAAELARVRVLNSNAKPNANSTWLPASGPPEGTYIEADGSFKTRVKRGVSTRLWAWHPWLVPADPGGEIELDAGREGVVLKLVSGDEVRLAVPQLVALRNFQSARVAVYDGAVQGEPRTWLHAPLIDGALRLGGLARGRATLWVDPGREFSPLVFENVEVGVGVTDLGEANFSRGSSLRVKLAVKAGEIAPRIYVFARRESGPVLNRSLNSDGEAEVVLSGLEAGEYTVSLSSIMSNKSGGKRQLQFDGTSDVEIAFEPR